MTKDQIKYFAKLRKEKRLYYDNRIKSITSKIRINIKRIRDAPGPSKGKQSQIRSIRKMLSAEVIRLKADKKRALAKIKAIQAYKRKLDKRKAAAKKKVKKKTKKKVDVFSLQKNVPGHNLNNFIVKPGAGPLKYGGLQPRETVRAWYLKHPRAIPGPEWEHGATSSTRPIFQDNRLVAYEIQKWQR